MENDAEWDEGTAPGAVHQRVVAVDGGRVGTSRLRLRTECDDFRGGG